MKKLIILLLVNIIYSCESNDHSKNDLAKKNSFDFLNDTLYKYKNFKGTLKIDWSDSEFENNYILADSITINLLLNHEESPIESPYYGARYVAKQKKIGNIQPIIIYVSSDDYSSYILVTLDNKKHLIDLCEIAGGWFESPHGLNDSIGETGGDSFFTIVDQHNINKFVTKYIYKYYLDSNNSFNIGDDIGKDSLYYRIKIENSGKITTSLIDSVRIPIKQTKEIH